MNKYEVTSIIDQGAYGIVLKARNKETGQYFAIKKFKDPVEDGEVDSVIQREVRMLRKMKSEYVIDLKEAFRRKGKIYLVFEYMQKNVLQLIEESDSGLHSSMVRKIIYLTVKAISFLHSHNVAHRDIKPENLLLNNARSVEMMELKICDFGFTRYINTGESLTEYVATRWYRSPELLVRDSYGLEADMWAVGCIMAELIDGQPLFPGENQIDQIYLIMKMLGPLTSNQQSALHRTFKGIHFPPIKIKQPLDLRYAGKVNSNELKFLKACLKADPNERLTAHQALNHPYLQNTTYGEARLNLYSAHRRYEHPSLELPYSPTQMSSGQQPHSNLYQSKATENFAAFRAKSIRNKNTLKKMEELRTSIDTLSPQKDITHKVQLELFPSQASLPRPKLDGEQGSHNSDKYRLHPNLLQVRNNVHFNFQSNILKKPAFQTTGALTLRSIKSNSQPFASLEHIMSNPRGNKRSPDLLITNSRPLM